MLPNTSHHTTLRRLAITIALLAVAGHVGAQFGFNTNPQDELRSETTLPTARSLETTLNRSVELLADGNVADAITSLQLVIDADEDAFPMQDEGPSLKSQADAQLAELSADARQLYHQRFEPDAAARLAEARNTGNPAMFAEIVRRYFHTPSGRQAAEELAGRLFDRGEFLASARLYDRLVQSASTDRSRSPFFKRAIAAWCRAGQPGRAVTRLMNRPDGIDGIPSFANLAAAAQWCEQQFGPILPGEPVPTDDWIMPRGRPDGNGVAEPTTPVWDGDWTLPTLMLTDVVRFPSDETGRKKLEQIKTLFDILQSRYSDQEAANIDLLPVHQPLVVGNRVIYGGCGRLKCVDRDSGKLLWASAADLVDESFKYLVHRAPQLSARRDLTDEAGVQTLLSQRLWRDQVAASLSTNGEFVYQLLDVGALGMDTQRRTFPVVDDSSPLAPRRHNRLVCYDLETGKLKHVVGGPRGVVALELAGTFFLGPPLPMGDELFIIGEENGQVRLFVLDAETLAVQRSQALLNPTAGLDLSVTRRMTALTPVAAGGLILCPTGDGAVVAVDRYSGRLAWTYQYPTTNADLRAMGRAAIFQQLRNPIGIRDIITGDRWYESSIIIEGDRAVMTAADSDDLHCISLEDGTALWPPQPRKQGMYVACVTHGAAIICGTDGLRAVRLSDGADAWDQPIPLPAPSGRGVRAGAAYLVPLSTDEVAAIDVHDGRLLARAPTRGGRRLGNLIAAGGILFSQNATELVRFKSPAQLNEQIAIDLAADEDDPAALALRGEMKLFEGDESAGLTDLRQSLARGPNRRASHVLTGALLEGLRNDFDRYRPYADEIRKTAVEPKLRITFLRVLAEGLERSGEYREAFDTFLDLTAPDLSTADGTTPIMENIGPNLLVRSDRWVQARLGQLYQQMSATEQQEVNADIRRQVEDAQDDEVALRRLLAHFRQFPVSVELKRALLEQWQGQENLLEQEQTLLELRETDDLEQRGWATDRLLGLYAQVQQSQGVIAMLEELAGPLADVVCLKQLTGAELADRWRSEEDVAALLQQRPDWPLDEATIVMKEETQRTRQSNGTVLPITAPLSVVYADWEFALDPGGRTLHAIDPAGRIAWQAIAAKPSYVNASVPGMVAGTIRGNLMLLTLPDRYLVYDLLSKRESPMIRDSLLDSDSDHFLSAPAQTNVIRASNPSGLRRPYRSERSGEYVGSAELLTGRLLCHQRGGRLYAIDPVKRETLWVRNQLPEGCDIFGDEEVVILKPPRETKFTVLDARDGRELGTRRWPQADPLYGDAQAQISSRNHFVRASGIPRRQGFSQGADPTRGRGVLISMDIKSRNANLRQRIIGLYDVLTEENRWERDFAADAVVTLLRDGDVAVVEPGKGLTILDAATGEQRLFAPFTLEGSLLHPVVMSDNERYYVMEQREALGIADQARGFVPNSTHRYPVNGRVLAIDATSSQVLWQTEVTRSDIEINQPVDWPFLVFSGITQQAAEMERPLPLVPNNLRSHTAMKLLDKRSGEVIQKMQLEDAATNSYWAVSPEPPTIHLRHGSIETTVTFDSGNADAPR